MSLLNLARTNGTPTPTRRGSHTSRPARGGRNMALEGLRGGVMFLTMFFHAWQFSGGQGDTDMPGVVSLIARGTGWAVAYFFVLTGMLVYGSYCKKVYNGADPGPAGRSLMRRLMRILPLYWLILIIVWAARNPGFPGDFTDLIKHATLTQVYDQERIFWSIGPSWSLAPQIALYLLLALLWRPLAKVAEPRSQRGRVAILAIVPAVLIVSGVVYLLVVTRLAPAAADNWPIWFNPLAQAPALGLGMAIALLNTVRPVRFTSRRARVLVPTVAILAAAGMSVLGQSDLDSTFAVQTFRIVSTVVFGLFILASLGLPTDSVWSRAWSWRPLVWLGTISFSVYLWHEPAMLLMKQIGLVAPTDSQWWIALVQVVVGIAAGWVSYRFLETPMALLTEVVAPRGAFQRRYDLDARRAPAGGNRSANGRHQEARRG